MYRAEVVEACRKVKDIRDNIAVTMSEIEAMPMDKIIEIARSPKTYSPVAVRCAQILMKKEDDRRKAALAERQRREEAELQARREAELQRRKEQMQQVLEFIKKWKYAIGAAVSDEWLRIAEAYENADISRKYYVWPNIAFTAGYAYFMHKDYDAAATLFQLVIDEAGNYEYLSDFASAYLGIININKLNSNHCSRKEAFAMLSKAPREGIFSFYRGLGELACIDNRLSDRLKEALISFQNTYTTDEYIQKPAEICAETVNNLIEMSVWNRHGYYYDDNKGQYTGQTAHHGWSEGANGWGVFYYKNSYVNYGKFNYLQSEQIDRVIGVSVWLDDNSWLFYINDTTKGNPVSFGDTVSSSINPLEYKCNLSLLSSEINLTELYGSPLSPIYNHSKYEKLMLETDEAMCF